MNVGMRQCHGFFFLFGAFELVWHAHPDKRPFLLPTAIEIQKCCVVETDNGILSFWAIGQFG